MFIASKSLLIFSVLLWTIPHASFANDSQDPPEHNTWVDSTHKETSGLLNRTARYIDGWFGKAQNNKPARASIRLMLDTHYNEFDGTTVKPRIRGKIKLPTLEHRLSVMIGDDDLDYEHGGGIYNDQRLATPSEHTFDRHQAKEDNTSLALRWSKLQQDMGISTDADIGLRSNDIFVRLQAEKKWKSGKIDGRAEQMYRYGSKSEHLALSTLEFSQPQSKHRTLYNRSHIIYTHKKDNEELGWSNSAYQQHNWQSKYGDKVFSYGVYMGGDIDDKKPTLNTYGPYVSYRQPVWRPWLFIQTDLSYYNNKTQHKDHHMSAFGRIEMVF